MTHCAVQSHAHKLRASRHMLFRCDTYGCITQGREVGAQADAIVDSYATKGDCAHISNMHIHMHIPWCGR